MTITRLDYVAGFAEVIDDAGEVHTFCQTKMVPTRDPISNEPYFTPHINVEGEWIESDRMEMSEDVAVLWGDE